MVDYESSSSRTAASLNPLPAAAAVNNIINSSNLNVLLQRVDASISDLQSQIESSIDSTIPQQRNVYNTTMQSLLADLESIESDIHTLEVAVNEPERELEKLNSLGCEVTLMQQTLHSLSRCCGVLQLILSVQKQMDVFDVAIESSYFDVAADALSQAKSLKEQISSQIIMLQQQQNQQQQQQQFHHHHHHHHQQQQQSSSSSMAVEKPWGKLRSVEENPVIREIAFNQIACRQVKLERVLYEIVDGLFCFHQNGVEILQSESSAASADTGSGGGGSNSSSSGTDSNKKTSEGVNNQRSRSSKGDCLSIGLLGSNAAEGGIEAVSGGVTTLEQLWHALKGIGCLKSEIRSLASSLQNSAVAPVICGSQRLDKGRTLIAKVTKNVSLLSSNLLWTWFECDADLHNDSVPTGTAGAPVAVSSNAVVIQMEVFGSLFEFIAKYFFPGHPEALQLLGMTLYDQITKALVSQLRLVGIDENVLMRLAEFETKLRGLNVIPFNTNILNTFTKNHEMLFFEQNKSKLLDSVRKLCLSTDPAVILVGENSDDDILIRCLNEIEESKLNSESFGEIRKVILQLSNSNSNILPKCYVSRAAYETVQLIDDLLSTVFNRIKQQNVDDGLFDSLIETIQTAVALFCLLRTSVHKKRIEESPLFGSVFFCDCLYLSHRLLLVHSGAANQPPACIQPHQSKLTFIHTICTIRAAQQEAFCEMVAYQKNQLLCMCHEIRNLTALSIDRHYADVEGQIGQIIQVLKGLSSCWEINLPPSISKKCLSFLLTGFLKFFLAQICDQVHSTLLSSPDKQALAYLLSSTRDQLRIVTESSSFSAGPADNVSAPAGAAASDTGLDGQMWAVFCLFRELIDGDVLEFCTKKEEIKESLSVREVQTILILNEKKSISDSDVFRLLV